MELTIQSKKLEIKIIGGFNLLDEMVRKVIKISKKYQIQSNIAIILLEFINKAGHLRVNHNEHVVRRDWWCDYMEQNNRK